MLRRVEKGLLSYKKTLVNICINGTFFTKIPAEREQKRSLEERAVEYGGVGW
jgi:hypothetical protein